MALDREVFCEMKMTTGVGVRMFRTVTNERALSWMYRRLFVIYPARLELRHRLTELAAAISFLLLAIILFAATAKAVEATGRDDKSFPALRDYVQSIDKWRQTGPQPGPGFKKSCAR